VTPFLFSEFQKNPSAILLQLRDISLSWIRESESSSSSPYGNGFMSTQIDDKECHIEISVDLAISYSRDYIHFFENLRINSNRVSRDYLFEKLNYEKHNSDRLWLMAERINDSEKWPDS
jgi:hypothetical protein